MALDERAFRDQLAVFKERILRNSKQPFVSFHEGLAADWESYKEPLRQRALVRLGVGLWNRTTIGSGHILQKLISAIEIPKEGVHEANNLVNWPNEYGHRNRSHYVFLDAQTDPDLCRQIEDWAFEFYRGGLDYANAFEIIRGIAGSRYDLLAYLFFLRDSERFMPIGSQTFDRAFQVLGISVRTSWRCSWENYQEYIAALQDIRRALTDYAGLSDIRLVDAHSFCWLLVRPELERPDVRFINSAKGKASNAKIYSGREIAIYEMADNTVNTVNNAKGQHVQVMKKVKELWMSKVDLLEFIDRLMERQKDRCALTGIAFNFDTKSHEKHLRPSLDRIDSNGHYEVNNLQVVCRFINQWKGAMPDPDFRRLLELVRRPYSAD